MRKTLDCLCDNTRLFLWVFWLVWLLILFGPPYVDAKKCKAVFMVDYVNGTPQIPEVEGAEVIGYSVYKDKVTGNGRVKIQLEFDDDADCAKREVMKTHMQHVKDIEEEDDQEDDEQ